MTPRNCTLVDCIFSVIVVSVSETKFIYNFTSEYDLLYVLKICVREVPDIGNIYTIQGGR